MPKGLVNLITPSPRYDAQNEAQFRRQLERSLIDVAENVAGTTVGLHAATHLRGATDPLGLDATEIDPGAFPAGDYSFMLGDVTLTSGDLTVSAGDTALTGLLTVVGNTDITGDVRIENKLYMRKDVSSSGTSSIFWGDDADEDMFELRHQPFTFSRERMILYDNIAATKKDILTIWQGEDQAAHVPGVTIPEDDGTKGMFQSKRIGRFDSGLSTKYIMTAGASGTIEVITSAMNQYYHTTATGVATRYRIVRNNTTQQGSVLFCVGATDNLEEWCIGMSITGSRNFKIIDNTDGGNTTVIDFGDALVGGTPIIGFNRLADFTAGLTGELQLGLAAAGGSPIATDVDKIRMLGSERATVGDTVTSYQMITFEHPEYHTGDTPNIIELRNEVRHSPFLSAENDEGHAAYFCPSAAGERDTGAEHYFGIYRSTALAVDTTTIEINSDIGLRWDAGAASGTPYRIWENATDFSIGNLDLTVLSAGGVQIGDRLIVQDAAPQIRLFETDETLPVGLWRLNLSGALLTLDENTHVSGDFSTSKTWIKVQPVADGDSKVRLWFINDLLGDKAVILGDGSNDPNKGGTELWRLDGTDTIGGIFINKPNSSRVGVTLNNVMLQLRNNDPTDQNHATLFFSTRTADEAAANDGGINAAHMDCMFENRNDVGDLIRASIRWGTANDEATSSAHERLVLRYDGMLHPFADSVYDLGLTATRWRFLYVDDVAVTGDVNAATFTGDGSALTALDMDNTLISVLGAPTYVTGQERINVQDSVGYIAGGVISDSGGGQIDVAAGQGFIKATDSAVAELLSFDWGAETNLTITADTSRYVLIEYNSGSPQVRIDSSRPTLKHNEFLLGAVYNEGGTLHIIQDPDSIEGFAHRANHRFEDVDGLIRANTIGGLTLGETGTNNVTVSAGTLFEGVNEFTIAAIDTSGADTFDAYYDRGTWTKVASQTAYDNAQYDNAGTLTTLGTNKWVVHYFYIESDGALVMVYGDTQYNTEAGADGDPAPSQVPGRINLHGLLIGRMLVQDGAGTATIESAFDAVFATAGVSDHGSLAGLGDNDHPQYTLVGHGHAASEITAGTFGAGDYVTTGDITVGDDLTVLGDVVQYAGGTAGWIGTSTPSNNQHVVRLYNGDAQTDFTIGFTGIFNHGYLGSDSFGSGVIEWAMCFNMSNSTTNRGWIWREHDAAGSAAAMSLTTVGQLYLDSVANVGSLISRGNITLEDDSIFVASGDANNFIKLRNTSAANDFELVSSTSMVFYIDADTDGTELFEWRSGVSGGGAGTLGMTLSEVGLLTVTASTTSPTVRGSIASGGDLLLESTSHATKGNINFGTSTYDEVNDRLGVGTASPGSPLHVIVDGGLKAHIHDTTTGGNTIVMHLEKTTGSPILRYTGQFGTWDMTAGNFFTFVKSGSGVTDFRVESGGVVRIAGVLQMLERAAAPADAAGYGQLWVKTATPNELWFTDDAGTDTQIV